MDGAWTSPQPSERRSTWTTPVLRTLPLGETAGGTDPQTIEDEISRPQS